MTDQQLIAKQQRQIEAYEKLVAKMEESQKITLDYVKTLEARLSEMGIAIDDLVTELSARDEQLKQTA